MKKKKKIYRILQFFVKRSEWGGALIQFQNDSIIHNALPFKIRKVLTICNPSPSEIRGNHAHYFTEEVVSVLRGGFTCVLEDGLGNRKIIRLESEDKSEGIKKALLIYPHIWRIFKDFTPETIFVIIANKKHDKSDYINDRKKFEVLANQWESLGGSDTID